MTMKSFDDCIIGLFRASLFSLVLEDGVGVGEGVQGSAEKVGEPEGLQPVVVGRRGQAALRSHDTR